MDPKNITSRNQSLFDKEKENDNCDSESFEDLQKLMLDNLDEAIMSGLCRRSLRKPSLDSMTAVEAAKIVIDKPKQMALVEIEIVGTRGEGGEIFYPQRILKFIIGDGPFHGLPIAIDVALCYTYVGETSLIMVDNEELLSNLENFDPNLQYTYEVTLKKLTNPPIPLLDDQLSLVEKIELSEEFNKSANKMFDAGQYKRSFKRFSAITLYMNRDTFCVIEIPSHIKETYENLLYQSFVGLLKCTIMDPELEMKVSADQFESLKQHVLSKSDIESLVRGNWTLGKFCTKVLKDYDNGIKFLKEAMELDEKNDEIKADYDECIEMQKKQLASEKMMAERMLNLDMKDEK